MGNAEIERLDDIGIKAWDTHDADTFVAQFADDFVWRDWTLPKPIRGDRSAAKQYFSSWGTAFPDMRVKQTWRVIGEDSIAAEVEYTGTNTGPMVMAGNTIPPTGRSVVGRGSYFARVKDGKVVEFSSHPDAAGLMMQLGLMPQPSGV
jgi:predicted ester cyclase